MKLTNYSALIVFVILFAQISTIILQSKAQSPEQGNIIFVRKTVADTFAVDYRTGEQTPAHNGRCSRYSRQLNYLARFNGQNPDRLEFIELSTGTIVSTLPWQAEWGNDFRGLPCLASKWLDNNTFILASAEDPDLVYDIDWQSSVISVPYRLSTIDLTPQSDPESITSDVFSPSGRFVVYRRCSQPSCDSSKHFVIYDIEQQNVVTELTGQFSEYGAVQIIPEEVFAWSHDERYLVHDGEEGQLVIYDLNQDAYLDLGTVPDEISPLSNRPGGVKWSANSRWIAFPVTNALQLGYLFDDGIIIIDILTQTYQIFEVPPENMPFSSNVFQWGLTNDYLLFADKDGDMYRLNINDGSLDFVDDHVFNIFAWFPPRPASSVSSLSYLSADQTLNDGTTIYLAPNLTIRANTTPETVGSVVFSDGTNTIVDNEAPYEFPITSAGSYTLTATPYSEADGGGTAGTPLTIEFTVSEP